MSARQTPESFWARIDVGDPDRCWEWQGACNNTGYGTVSWHGRRLVAHRVAAWLSQLIRRPEAPHDRRSGGFVLHGCDNPKCCNPSHFEIGTYKKNQLDAYARRRRIQHRGHHHANAKLAPRTVRAIRRNYEHHGATQVQLAEYFGVSQTAISRVVRGETYTNV